METKSEVWEELVRMTPLEIKAKMINDGNLGVLITENSEGKREVHGQNEKIAFGFWSEAIWYSMVGVADAPWTLLCPESEAFYYLSGKEPK